MARKLRCCIHPLYVLITVDAGDRVAKVCLDVALVNQEHGAAIPVVGVTVGDGAVEARMDQRPISELPASKIGAIKKGNHDMTERMVGKGNESKRRKEGGGEMRKATLLTHHRYPGP